MAETTAEHAGFEIIIVYGVNKPLRVTETETIDTVKLGAMNLFGIASAEAGHYILRVKQGDKDVQLPENETVAQVKLHREQHVTLAAGTPYGTV